MQFWDVDYNVCIYNAGCMKFLTHYFCVPASRFWFLHHAGLQKTRRTPISAHDNTLNVFL